MCNDPDLFGPGEREVTVLGNGKIDWRKYRVTIDIKDPGKCSKCGADIWVAKTLKGKKMPIEYSEARGGFISHYDNCKR